MLIRSVIAVGLTLGVSACAGGTPPVAVAPTPAPTMEFFSSDPAAQKVIVLACGTAGRIEKLWDGIAGLSEASAKLKEAAAFLIFADVKKQIPELLSSARDKADPGVIAVTRRLALSVDDGEEARLFADQCRSEGYDTTRPE